MDYYSVTRIILSFLFVGCASASSGWAQPPGIYERPVLDIKGMKKAHDLRYFGGLDPQVGGRIREEIRGRGSLLELLVGFGGQFEDRAKLDQNQRPEFQAVVEKRKRQRNETVEETFRLVREMHPFEENEFRLLISKAWKKEDEHEAAFTTSLQEILDPTQLDMVCKAAMGYLRPEFARHPLIVSHLKLSKEQVAKFDRWRMENHEVVKRESDYRKSLQKDNRPLTDQQEIEVKKFFNGITTNLVNYARDADNSLTKEQFQFVARAEAIIRDDETLDEYFDRQTETEQTKLAANWVHFERILEERRK